MRQTIRLRNPDVPVRAETMETTMELASATPRFRAYLVGLFATVALFLALVGVYGVTAQAVGRRFRQQRLEIGQHGRRGAGLCAPGMLVTHSRVQHRVVHALRRRDGDAAELADPSGVDAGHGAGTDA